MIYLVVGVIWLATLIAAFAVGSLFYRKNAEKLKIAERLVTNTKEA